MKLLDCRLDVDLVVTAPLEWDEPEASWVAAREGSAIPESLFALYRSSRYLSLSAIAGVSNKDELLVSAYFVRIMRGLKELLVESRDLAAQLPAELKAVYTPAKRARG